MKVAVIGAGASGMAASLHAAWHGAQVKLFERNRSIGRKLLVTGSGRCNLSNEAVTGDRYTCADPAWMNTQLTRFGVNELLSMLYEIGIPTYKTDDGWYYPLSNSAQSVVEAFSSALDRAGVEISCLAQVTSIRPDKNGIFVECKTNDRTSEESFERVIVSAGGKAYPTLGSRGEMFPVLEQLGHTVIPKRPALAPILADLGGLQSLQGMRLDVGVSLLSGRKIMAVTRGNMIFTSWGVNGPAVMDISHLVAVPDVKDQELSLNLLAFFQNEFEKLLASNRHHAMPVKVILTAFFPPKVALVYLSMVGIPENTPLCELDDRVLDNLVTQLNDTRLPIKGVRGFEYCQLSAGGVPVTEVNPMTLESSKVKGLYLTGEILDVVGPCGGYNLQFAFGSGALAGMSTSGKTTIRKQVD